MFKFCVIVCALITAISSDYCEQITSIDSYTFNTMTPIERLELSIKCIIEHDKQGNVDKQDNLNFIIFLSYFSI